MGREQGKKRRLHLALSGEELALFRKTARAEGFGAVAALLRYALRRTERGELPEAALPLPERADAEILILLNERERHFVDEQARARRTTAGRIAREAGLRFCRALISGGA